MAAHSERRISISRSLSVVLALLTIAAAAVVFEEKGEAARTAADVSRLRAKIEQEKERISELKAEWSLLDQPARLQSIIEQHPDVFHVAPMQPTQIGRIEDLPFPVVEAPKADAHGDGGKPGGKNGATKNDGTKTAAAAAVGAHKPSGAIAAAIEATGAAEPEADVDFDAAGPAAGSSAAPAGASSHAVEE